MTCNCPQCRGEGPPDDEVSEPPAWFIRKISKRIADLCDDEIMEEWIKYCERKR